MSPELAIASTVSLMSFSLTLQRNWFHVFQPIGGVLGGHSVSSKSSPCKAVLQSKDSGQKPEHNPDQHIVLGVFTRVFLPMALVNLTDFVLDSVVKDDPHKKVITLVGSLKDKEGTAIVLLEKVHWDAANIATSLKEVNLTLKTLNNQYGHYAGTGPQSENNLGVWRMSYFSNTEGTCDLSS